jgi:hypothetical protein
MTSPPRRGTNCFAPEVICVITMVSSPPPDKIYRP